MPMDVPRSGREALYEFGFGTFGGKWLVLWIMKYIFSSATLDHGSLPDYMAFE